MKSTDLVYASDVEEFFWEEDGVSVPEGTPVGYEVEVGNSVDFISVSYTHLTLPTKA